MSKRRYYNFDSFRVDPTERVLLCDGKPISLSPKVFDTLLALVERSGHIVSKDQLFEIVWPDVFVEENNLTQYERYCAARQRERRCCIVDGQLRRKGHGVLCV